MFGINGIATHPNRKQGHVGDGGQVHKGGEWLKTCALLRAFLLLSPSW